MQYYPVFLKTHLFNDIITGRDYATSNVMWVWFNINGAVHLRVTLKLLAKVTKQTDTSIHGNKNKNVSKGQWLPVYYGSVPLLQTSA
jgi:hypothetical protein